MERYAVRGQEMFSSARKRRRFLSCKMFKGLLVLVGTSLTFWVSSFCALRARICHPFVDPNPFFRPQSATASDERLGLLLQGLFTRQKPLLPIEAVLKHDEYTAYTTRMVQEKGSESSWTSRRFIFRDPPVAPAPPNVPALDPTRVILYPKSAPTGQALDKTPLWKMFLLGAQTGTLVGAGMGAIVGVVMFAK